MAYRDSSGRITIDEDAANADIRKLREAAGIMKSAVAQLGCLQSEANQFEGETARAISEKSQELRKNANQLTSNLEETERYIRHVVQHYRIVDEKCRAMLAAAAAAAKKAKRG